MEDILHIIGALGTMLSAYLFVSYLQLTIRLKDIEEACSTYRNRSSERPGTNFDYLVKLTATLEARERELLARAKDCIDDSENDILILVSSSNGVIGTSPINNVEFNVEG